MQGLGAVCELCQSSKHVPPSGRMQLSHFICWKQICLDKRVLDAHAHVRWPGLEDASLTRTSGIKGSFQT